MRMNLVERPKIRKAPEQGLREDIDEARELYSRELSEVNLRQGRRYRGIFRVYASFNKVPEQIQVAYGVALRTETFTIYNSETRKEIPTTDEFWAQHGYSVLQRLVLASNSSRNESARI